MQIALTQGQVATIDAEDFEMISQYKWCANKRKHRWYAVGYVRGSSKTKAKLVYMHRLIAKAETGYDVDHIDGNGLNNTKSNLRSATRSQNMQNERNLRGGTSIYKGVYFNAKRNRWIVEMKIETKKKHIGQFKTELEAARAYNLNALKHYGEFARLNLFEGETA